VRVLVTGIGGFVGPVVARALLERGHEVWGLARRPGGPRLTGLAVRVAEADVTDSDAVARVLETARPEAVIHLAGLTFGPAAEADPRAAYAANLGGTLAVLAALRAGVPRARLVLASSSEVYGAVRPEDLPVGEDVPLRPVSIYGATKAAAEIAAAQWGRAYGLDVVRVRPFNHTGPGQDAAFVCAALARQVAAIEAGRQEAVLRVGNVDPVRDFADVRDIAAGYVAVLERGRSGEVYNLCSGEGTSIAEVIAILRTLARVPLRARSAPELTRAVDVPRLVGSPARVARDTGWHARIPLAETLRAVLEDWRTRAA
jgi:GDP-4-dehydro-6-deoxy-D-mannose reductase